MAISAFENVKQNHSRLSDLAHQQIDILSSVSKGYAELEDDNERLRDEVHLLRAGRRDLNERIAKLEGNIKSLEGRIGTLTGYDPITLCLLDGDGCIFAEKYLKGGDSGGKAAAAALKYEIDARIGAGGSLCTFIYMNQSGLRNHLDRSEVCSPSQLDEFVIGFNRASELFSIVDVGVGKEAADAKIREMLKTFASVHQIKKIIFGGGHDSGYVTTLNSLKTHGFDNKLAILDYGQNARAINHLGIEQITIEGLFKQPTSPNALSTIVTPLRRSSTSAGSNGSMTPPGLGSPQLSAASVAAPTMATRVNGHGTASKVIIPTPKRSAIAQVLKVRSPPKVDRSKAMIWQTPTICNDFFLNDGFCLREECTYSHEYELTAKEVDRLRNELKKIKCKGLGCRAEECWYKH